MGDEVSVISVFDKGKVRPAKFLWHSKEYLVNKINLIHKVRKGASINIIFSVESNGETYHLEFDNSDLKWLLKIDSGSSPE